MNLRGVDDHPDIALADLPTAAVSSDVRVFVGDWKVEKRKICFPKIFTQMLYIGHYSSKNVSTL